jgi:N-methylhydantoinase A
MSTYRLDIDIGGTFTDGTLMDGTTGEILIVRVPTTPIDPALGFITTLERALQRSGSTGETVCLMVHATTVATNALNEGKTARVGMITTRGFRDVLEIGRQIRSRLYDLCLTQPRPLVPRRWSIEVRERLDAEGRVLEPLDTEAVCHAVRQPKAEEVEAIVCCFLHSYLNPVHERLAANIIRAE